MQADTSLANKSGHLYLLTTGLRISLRIGPAAEPHRAEGGMAGDERRRKTAHPNCLDAERSMESAPEPLIMMARQMTMART